MSGGPLNILFVSTGNAARSLIAEAVMRAKGGCRFNARSAGLMPEARPHAETLALLTAAGLPVSGLHTKNVGEFLAAATIVPMHVIVTLSDEARRGCPTWPTDVVRVHWTVDDPLSCERADMREWKFRKCLATLESRVAALIKTRVAQSSTELLLQLKDAGMVV